MLQVSCLFVGVQTTFPEARIGGYDDPKIAE
jgi:hypothetical protein